MGPLKSPRREAFAQNIAKSPKTGKTLGPCYEASGYSARGHSAEQLGSQLLKNVEVKSRVDEIMRPAVVKSRITVESLLNELEITIGDARAAKQHGTVVAALTLSGRLLGLLKDRIEVSTGGYNRDLTTEELVQNLVDQTGEGDPGAALAWFDEVSAEIRAALEARAAAGASTVRPTPRPSNEAALGLAALRSTPKGSARAGYSPDRS